MRVLFWSEMFWPYVGGAEIILAKLILALRERGYDLIVVTRRDSPSLPEEDTFNGIPVFRFPFWMALTDANLSGLTSVRRKIVDLKSKFAPDIVHINGFAPTSGFLYLQTASAHPSPILVTLHGTRLFQDAKKNSLLEHILLSAAWITGCSQSVLARARDLVPEILSHSSVIYNGSGTYRSIPNRL